MKTKTRKPEVRTLKLSELKGWDKNPRKITADARAGLRASLAEFGCVWAIRETCRRRCDGWRSTSKTTTGARSE